FDRVNPSQTLNWFYPPNYHTGAATFSAQDDALKRRLGIQATAELLPMFDFALRSDELGLSFGMPHTPPDSAVQPDWLFHPTTPLFADRFELFGDFLAGLALAQHNKIPTRLL